MKPLSDKDIHNEFRMKCSFQDGFIFGVITTGIMWLVHSVFMLSIL